MLKRSLPAVLLVLAACGGPDQPTTFSNVGDLAKAMDKAISERKTSTFAMQGDIQGNGKYRQDGAGPALELTFTAEGQKITMQAVDKAIYLRFPDDHAIEPGKPWVKLTADGTDPNSRVFAPILASFQDSVQFTRSLDLVRDAATITQSTRDYYRLSVDTGKASDKPVIGEQMREAAKAGRDHLVWEVWLTGDNLPVRVTSQYVESGAVKSVTMTFADWGKPVEISTPAADQIGVTPR